MQDALEDEDAPVPDVLTVYLTGTDLYAHVAEEGPDDARRGYLRDVVDPALGILANQLRERNALEDRWVVVTSDHDHTPVRHDTKHALWTEGQDSPPGLMRKVGYRLRPFEMKVDADVTFDAVLCEGGATAYVYLADRSTCPNPKVACDWKKPPRYEEDVLPLAEAFFKNDADGKLAPRLKGTIDLILTRRPKPYQGGRFALRGLRRRRQDHADCCLLAAASPPHVHRDRGSPARLGGGRAWRACR